MKGMVKAIVAGVIITAIGIGLLLTGFALNDWKFFEPKFEMQRFDATADNTALDVDFGAGTLRIEYYDGEKIAIDYPVSNGFDADIFERDGKLFFETTKKWFTVNFGNWHIPETVIYLPRKVTFNLDFDMGAGMATLTSGTYGNVSIEVGAGTLTATDIVCNAFSADIAAGMLTATDIVCNTFDADVSAGKLVADSLTSPDIDISVSAGYAEATINGAKSEYTIKASASAGSCNVSDQTGTTNKRLNADCSAGSIVIKFTA